MKQQYQNWFAIGCVVFAACLIPLLNLNASDSAELRLGIYDSRAVAFAHFWSQNQQEYRNKLVQEAKKFKQQGNQDQYRMVQAKIEAEQKRSHLQVFSTAPAIEGLAAMTNRLIQIQKNQNLDRLVSRWDKETLALYPAAKKIDITDLLVHEFALPESKLKVIEDMKKKDPLPLKQAMELLDKGEL